MTTSKHTRGPWRWWDETTGRPKNYDLMHLDGPGKRILGCYGGAGFNALGKEDEDIANARLIVQAPAMYDYIFARAVTGDPLAQELLNKIHGECESKKVKYITVNVAVLGHDIPVEVQYIGNLTEDELYDLAKGKLKAFL